MVQTPNSIDTLEINGDAGEEKEGSSTIDIASACICRWHVSLSPPSVVCATQDGTITNHAFNGDKNIPVHNSTSRRLTKTAIKVTGDLG